MLSITTDKIITRNLHSLEQTCNNQAELQNNVENMQLPHFQLLHYIIYNIVKYYI